MPTHCKHCGSTLFHWDDIAAAMEAMIEVAPLGVKPMFLQAIDEIRFYRREMVRLGADGEGK